MKKNVGLKPKRIYNESFRKERVKEYESGKYTVLELARLYGIAYQTIYLWIYRYSAYNKRNLKIVEHKDSATERVTQLQGRIKELERIVGQKQIHIDFLEKLIELAESELGIDIKKNSSTSQSHGSKDGDKASHTA